MMNSKKSKQELRELYRDDYVSRYHQEDRGRLARLLPLMDLRPDTVVADFGCGNGILAEIIHDRVAHYYGVDFSSEFIEDALRRHSETGIGNASFACQSIEEFCDAHKGEIDRAFAMDLTEHLYDEDLLSLLDSIRSCLRPDGRLYVHTPNRTFVLEILKDKGILRQPPEHIAVRNAEQYEALLERAGFRHVRVMYLAHYLRAVSWLDVFSHIPIIGRYFQARLFIECYA